jgi:membrane-bound lytic murein transglycosylase D
MPSILLEQDRNNLYYDCRRILREEKVPADFVYLFIAESTLRNRVSPKGAAGVCQMMPDAARTFGLEVNNEVDERYHFEKAVRAACAYLKKSHGFFNNWTMAAAAYNHGYNGMLRKRAAHPDKSYYDIPLNPETSRYMYRILCIKEAMRNPTKFGYAVKRMPKANEHKVKVDTAIADLRAFAEAKGVDYAEFKRLNPWLVSDKLSNPEHKTYTITLPIIPVLEEQEQVVVPAAAMDTQSMGNIQQRLFKFRAAR